MNKVKQTPPRDVERMTIEVRKGGSRVIEPKVDQAKAAEKSEGK